MTRRVHHNKYFTFSYEGEQYRGIFVDRGYSFSELVIERIVITERPKYFFFGPLVKEESYQQLTTLFSLKTIHRKPTYDIEWTRELCELAIGRFGGSHADQI